MITLENFSINYAKLGYKKLLLIYINLLYKSYLALIKIIYIENQSFFTATQIIKNLIKSTKIEVLKFLRLFLLKNITT